MDESVLKSCHDIRHTRAPKLDITEDIRQAFPLQKELSQARKSERQGSNDLNPHDTLSLNKVRDVPLLANPSSLIPEAGSIPGTPRNDYVIDWDQLVGLAVHRRDVERGDLEVALHDREDVTMQLYST